MGGIFINYRRNDSEYIAGRLRNDLSRRFGTDFLIFRDVDSLALGRFAEEIDQAVRSCDVMVVVIGDGWLDARDASGKKRLDQPDDWVRQEIAAGLRQKKILVPVLVENARLPSAHELPLEIAELVDQQAVELPDSRWDYEVEQLVGKLERSLRSRNLLPSDQQQELPAPPLRDSTRRSGPKWALAIIPVVLAAGVFAIVRSSGSGSECTRDRTPAPGRTTVASRQTDRSYTGPWSVTCGPLTLTIEKIETSASATRVHARVDNETDDTLILSASQFNMVDDNGHSYRANPFSSEWPKDIPPGVLRGIVDVVEPLRPEATSISAGWGTVFGTFAVDQIFVEGIGLR